MTREEVYSWSPATNYLDTYIWYNGKLEQLVDREGLVSIPTGRWSSIEYLKELDGDTLTKEEAIAKYPEYFI